MKEWSPVIVFIACLAALRVASKQNEHRRSVVAEKTPCIRIGVRVHGAFSATAEHLVVCPLWGGKYLTLNSYQKYRKLTNTHARETQGENYDVHVQINFGSQLSLFQTMLAVKIKLNPYHGLKLSVYKVSKCC